MLSNAGWLGGGSLLVLLVNLTAAQTANHPVISEVLVDGVNESLASNNDEFIEIYNPLDVPVDVSGWTVDYRSASGTTFNTKYTFLPGTILSPHRFWLVGGGGVVNRDNQSATIILSLGNAGGAVFLRNDAAATIDLFGWGSANSSNAEGTPHSTAAQGVSLERKAKNTSTSATMGSGGAEEFEGNGYDSDNNSTDFLTRSTPEPQSSSNPAEPSLSQNGNGTGAANIRPTVIKANTSSSFTISVVGDGTYTLDSIIVVVPATWTWGQNAGDVSLSGSGLSGGTVAVQQDTIYVGKGAVTKSDTGKIILSSVRAPDAAGSGIFVVKTALNGGTPIRVSSIVSVTVLRIARIIDVHVNDAQGVPVAPYASGTTVTVSGTITADLNASRTDVYVQDSTAGINIFRSTRSFDYQVGDSVTITGSILQFRGLTEIAPDTTKYILHAGGRSVPEPLVLTASDVNGTFNTDTFAEPNEGRLVSINGVTYNAAASTITDATGTTAAFIPSPLTPPTGMFDLIGILKQFKPGTPAPGPPYLSDYEVQPRTQEDIILHPGPIITSPPTEENILSNYVTIKWKTQSPSSSIVRYGLSSSYTDSVVINNPDTLHAVVLPNLQSSTVYHYQIASGDSSGFLVSGDAIFSSGSPETSTGIMNVYFSKPTNASVSLGENAQTVNIASKFIARVQAAKYSIDVSLYSLSGTVGSNIAGALLDAKNRGVKIRMIAEDDNAGTVPMTTMKNNVPFITDKFDPENNGMGLMHNKFAVFDFRDRSSAADDWVWTGSWNATDPGNNNDAQNALDIQDQALANAYTMEFEEMWGSSTDSPNASVSRFGFRKTNNTPHRFSVKGTAIESYFSPSDRTTSRISTTLSNSTSSINVAMLTLTRQDLAQVLISKETAGKKVRVLMDNNTDSGNQFAALKDGGVDVLLKSGSLGGLLHHKYAVVDAENTTVDNVVITGSHNWSSSAESSNNENTLIIHSQRIANLFLQEFKQRYVDAGGTDDILLTVEQTDPQRPGMFDLAQNFPNPFNSATTIAFRVPESASVSLTVYDVLGREAATLVRETMNPGSYAVRWNPAELSSGTYFYALKSGSYFFVRKMVLMK